MDLQTPDCFTGNVKPEVSLEFVGAVDHGTPAIAG
jgi:hypothetical protein